MTPNNHQVPERRPSAIGVASDNGGGDNKGSDCPSSDTWLEIVCDRDDTEAISRRPDLQAHLDGCEPCRAAVDEVRRYQTLLLRARVPGLSSEQRQSLEDRVRMMAGQWVPPPRVSPRLAWGIALAAAAVLVGIVGRPYLTRRAEHMDEFSRRVADATLPTADRPGPGVLTGAVEGGVEVADRDGNWRQLQSGEPVRTGMHLRSTAAGSGRVVVTGRFELRLDPATEVEVLAASRNDNGHAGDAAFRLRSGLMDCTVEKLRPSQRFVVMFAGFRASVIGTRFTVQHTTASAGVQVQVLEGAVRVDQADDWWKAPNGDTTVTARAGNRWRYSAGRMSLEPIPLPGVLPLRQPLLQPLAKPAADQPGETAPALIVSPVILQPAVESPVSKTEEAAATDTSVSDDTAGPAHQSALRTAIPRDAAAKASPGARRRKFLIQVPPQKMTPDEGLTRP